MIFRTLGWKVGGLTALLLATGTALSGDKEAREDINDLQLEVKALQAVDALDLKPKQLRALADLAKATAPEPRKRKAAKVSAEFRKTLHDLHKALSKKDEEKIFDLEAKLLELEDKENPELDIGVEMTAAAREKAPDLLKHLSAGQLASYIGANALADPLEVLEEALEKGESQKGDEWKETREEAAEEVGWLLGGLNEQKARDFAAEAGKLLDKAHSAKKTTVTEEMEHLISRVSSFAILRNSVEHSLAELLSNPRLSAALHARKKANSE